MVLYSVRSSLQCAASGTVPPAGQGCRRRTACQTPGFPEPWPARLPAGKTQCAAAPRPGRAPRRGARIPAPGLLPHGVVGGPAPAPPCPHRCRAGRTARQSSPAAPCAGPAARPATHRPAVRTASSVRSSGSYRPRSSRRWISANGFSSAAGKSRGRADR